MMKGTRNIGRAVLAFALVGAVGFSAIACKTDADENGGNGGDNGNGTTSGWFSGTVIIDPNGGVYGYGVGLNTLLTANYNGTETGITLTYQWHSGTTAINGATNNTYTPTTEGSYFVRVSASGYESIDSLPVTVNGTLKGEITITPNGDIAVNVELTAEYTGDEHPGLYQWNKDGTAIDGATKTTYTPTVAGSYTVTVRSSAEYGGHGPITSTTTVNVMETETDSDGLKYIKPGNGYILVGRDKTIHTGTTLTIPATFNGSPVTGIGERAFSQDNLAGELIIPDSVVTIGDRAFESTSAFGSGSNDLTKVTFGNKVETIGSYAFYNNRLTGELIIPDSVVTIGVGAFMGESQGRTNKITKVTFGSKVKTIGRSALTYNDDYLATVIIGKDVDVTGGDSGVWERFANYYNNDNGKKAGTYTYSGSAWTWKE